MALLQVNIFRYVFLGEWVHGLKEGKGIERMNGIIYDGEFLDDQVRNHYRCIY